MPGGGIARTFDGVERTLLGTPGSGQAAPGAVRVAASLELTLSDNTRITFGRLAAAA